MSSEPIDRPGETIASTLAVLLDLRETNRPVIEWHERMKDISESERSAENDGASVRIR